MRLSKETVAKREQFVKDLFTANPQLSAAKANEQLKAKEGSAMRVTRIYELKKIALAEKGAPVAPAATPAQPAEQQVAKRPGRRVNGTLTTVAFVPGDPAALRSAINTLEQAGVKTGITVEASGRDYAVVRKAQ